MSLNSSKRITSIDALRAFALFGILMVHVAQLYNFYNPSIDFGYYSASDEHLRQGLLTVFEDRCRTIFCILFGVSFFIIMRNAAYTTLRFCWRCVVLMVFGMINIEFYNSDFMLCYGIVGVMIAVLPLHRLKPWLLFLIAALLYSQQFVSQLDYTAYVFPEANYLTRHTAHTTLHEYLSYSYMASLIENLRMFLPGISVTLSYFVFGYALGRSGFIERIDELCNGRNVLIFAAISIAMRIVYQICGGAFWSIMTLSDSIFYSILFIFCTKFFPQWLVQSLSCYGRLGLTNYSMQNICGPMLMIIFALPFQLQFRWLLLGAVVFYVAQTIFSILWLSLHSHGPWESLWRKLV